MKIQRGSRGIALLPLTSALVGVGIVGTLREECFDPIHRTGLANLLEIRISSLRRQTHFRNWMIPSTYGANRH